MKAEFWRDKWERGEIGFHEGAPNRMLVKHFGALGLAAGARVFVPLCGKTRDVQWLRDQGARVVGAELSEIAIRELFEEMRLSPDIRPAGPFTHFAADGLDMFVGDVFDLRRETLGEVDAVYDRAALVALPAETRARYAPHIHAISGGAPQLLITFDYDQTEMDGPPFSVDAAEVSSLYGSLTPLALLERAEVPGGLKGRCAAEALVWRLG